MSSSRRRRCSLVFLLIVGAPVSLAVAAWLARTLGTPMDAPLARMYRTEANLALLVRAVETYQAEFGAYPVPGATGIGQAVAHLSRNVNYLPGGAPLDGWDRPYVFIPYTRYAEPELGALRCGSEYCAPDSYQLYSAGADGDAGINAPTARSDNICSWEPGKPWRTAYEQM